MAAGKSEVKITVTDGDRQANARVTVEVGGAGPRLTIKPGKVRLNVGAKDKLGLFTDGSERHGTAGPVRHPVEVGRFGDRNGGQGLVPSRVYRLARHECGQRTWDRRSPCPSRSRSRLVRRPTHGQPILDITITSALGQVPARHADHVHAPGLQHQRTESGTPSPGSWMARKWQPASPLNAGSLEPGRHYVQLVMKSSDPRENDAVTKNFNVEYPPEMEVTIGFVPETNVYEVGATVGFVAKVKECPARHAVPLVYQRRVHRQRSGQVSTHKFAGSRRL